MGSNKKTMREDEAGRFANRIRKPIASAIETSRKLYAGNAVTSALRALKAHADQVWLASLLLAISLLHLKALHALPHKLQLDSLKVYLPGAEKLLSDGAAFFATPEAYRTAPLNFIWPALFSAQPPEIIAANLWLSVITLILVFLAALLLCNRVAAVAAAILYGCSPLIAPLFPTVLSEPQFLVGTALWFAGTVGYVARGTWWLSLAFIGGVVSLFARPIWLPFLVVSIPLLAFASLQQPKQPAWRKLLLVHVLIVIAVAGYCLHNELQFGFFGISTGGGASLYLGNHPLTWGIEPAHLSLDYDVPSMLIPWGGDHLSITGDRVLRSIGWSMIWDRSYSEQVQWLLYKIGAILFFTKGDFAPDLYSIRTLRVAELAFAAYGLGFIRSLPLRCWLLGAVLLQIGQLSMVLYNIRYSVGSLEIWLVVLASCGIARMLGGVRGALTREHSEIAITLRVTPTAEGVWPKLAVVVAIVVATGIGHWHRRLTDPLQPNVEHAPVRTLLELNAPPIDEFHSRNVVGLPNGAYYVSRDEGLFAIDLPDPPPHERGLNQFWSLTLTIVPPKGTSCRGGRISYESLNPLSDVPFTALPIEFKGDGQLRRYAISATHPVSPLYPASRGVLRFRPFCPKDTQVAIHRVSLLESTGHKFYLTRVEAP